MRRGLSMLLAFLTLATLATMAAACVSDVRALRIPNLYSVVVIVAFGIAFLAAPESFGAWWTHLAAFAGMFAVTYVMFCFNMLGAGDSKFGSALALWVGLKGLLPYIFYMAIAGGIVGVLALYFRKKKPFRNPPAGSWMALAQEGRNAVPYGIAISFGGAAALLHTGFVHHQLDELFRLIH